MSTNELTTGSLKDLLRLPFRGPQWQTRFLIGMGLALANFIVPFVPAIFLYGYACRVMRQTIDGEELELPAWEDWGKLGRDGLRMMLVQLLYLLPGLVVMFGGMGLYFASFFMIIPIMAASDTSNGAAIVIPLLIFVMMGVMFLAISIGSLLLFLGMIPLPVASAHFVAKDELVAGWRVGEWWRLLWGNKLGYLAAWVVVAGRFAILYYAVMYYS